MEKPTRGPAVTAVVLAGVTWAALFAAKEARAAPGAAPPHDRAARLSIASPVTGNLVAGLVPVAVAFDAGAAGRVTLVELWVDDLLYNSQPVDLTDPRGTLSIDWDTQRLRNGQHSLKVRAFSGRKLIATDSALVTLSNGGADVVPPLVSFYAPLDGQTVSGNLDIGINASDNDQVALVGLFVNRQLRLMKSDPPFKYTLDTTTLPLLNGRGVLKLEAWAYDRAQNRGVAKPITVYVNNPINATPLEQDPKGEKGREGHPTKPTAANHPVSPLPVHRPAAAPRVGPLAALQPPAAAPPPPVAPAKRMATAIPPTPAPPISSPAEKNAKEPGESVAHTDTGVAAPALPSPSPSRSSRPSTLRGSSANGPSAKLNGLAAAPAAPRRPAGLMAVKPAAAPQGAHTPGPSPTAIRRAPAAVPPSRNSVAVKPTPATPRLEVSLGAPAIATPSKLKAAATPPRTRPTLTHPKLAPVLPPVSRIARVPAEALIAAPQPASLPAARPAPKAETPTRTLPEPHLPAARPATARRAPSPAAERHIRRAAHASAPDRIVLPVYRLARLPDSLATSHEYTVRRGDSLGGIAREHGVTPRSILVASGLLRASEITPGRRLSIPGTFAIAYNDQPIGFDVPPRVEKGMAIAPFRQIFEHTGGVVRYQPAEREVLARSPEKQISLKIGSREALVNSAVVLMDRAAFLDSGRTMVPVKFMSQALDLKAEYDLRTGAIYLIHQERLERN